jgi:apolipoprotein D and lipocalin family protein
LGIDEALDVRHDLDMMLQLLLSVFTSSYVFAAHIPLMPTKDFDLNAYSGKWYEIARIENEFEIGCRGTTIDYKYVSNTLFDVESSCWVGEGSQERRRVSNGRAWVDELVPSKIKLSFVHFLVWWKLFANEYWVLDAGPVDESGHYTFAVVGHPRRKYGWVYSRVANPDAAAYDMLVSKLKSQGYDPSLFKRTDQSPNIE